MSTINRILSTIFFSICSSALSAQNPSVSLVTDRSYYLPGESVMFKAFCSVSDTKKDAILPDSLHLIILDQQGLRIAQKELPVSSNIVKGNIDLPDFLSEGSYILVAYAVRMQKPIPDLLDSRIIDIRHSLDSYIYTDISLTEPIYEPGSRLTAQVRFSGNGSSPVPAVFSYEMDGKTDIILDGNNKANNDGFFTLKLQLPKFDSKEILKLIIVPSYKGVKSVAGIVIPTRYNLSNLEEDTEGSITETESAQLNIQLKTTSMSAERNEKVNLEISVADEKGEPKAANLSVSASVIIPHQFTGENDNLPEFKGSESLRKGPLTMDELTDYFTQLLQRQTEIPGHAYKVQEKNSVKKLQRKENAPRSSGSTLFWDPELNTNESGKASVSFSNSDKACEVLVTVEGRSADGTSGKATMQYSVK
jgi:hypothetical protein